MRQIEYSEEAKSYFLDNYPYTFDLLVRIEELKFTTGRMLPTSCVEIDLGYYWWETLGHAVVFEQIDALTLYVVSIKPLE